MSSTNKKNLVVVHDLKLHKHGLEIERLNKVIGEQGKLIDRAYHRINELESTLLKWLIEEEDK